MFNKKHDCVSWYFVVSGMDNRRRKLKLDGQLINELTRSDSSSESEPESKRFCPSDVDDDSFEDLTYEVPERPKLYYFSDSDDDSTDDGANDRTYEGANDGSDDEVNDGEENEANNGTRWRKLNPTMWKSNIRKRLYRRGEQHINSVGKEVPRKSPRSVAGHKCRENCTEKIDQRQRESLCQQYWGLEDYKRKKDYILGNVKTFAPKQRRERSKKPRAESHKYLFTCNGEEIRVCKAFFLATLCISNNAVLKAFSDRSDHNTFIGGDKRGHHEPKHKLSAERHQFIKNHIESFRVVESHYCRADTSRKY